MAEVDQHGSVMSYPAPVLLDRWFVALPSWRRSRFSRRHTSGCGARRTKSDTEAAQSETCKMLPEFSVSCHGQLARRQ